jgi:uncharacterized protein (DUF1015 family)
MAVLHPFRGLRYNSAIVADLNRVVAQPYDKTTPSMQDHYYQSSPFNVERITLNLEKRKNPETLYPEAGALFRKWIGEKVLVQDASPAMYAYYQQYAIEGQVRVQHGLIALLDLAGSGAGVIPHEQTLAAPKQDRLRLMRSLEGNEDQIYMLYSDEKLEVNSVMEKGISGRQPEVEVTDEYGTIHRIWAITDRAALTGIQHAMNSLDLFIADGHHRFETSVTFMKECRAKGWKPAGVESFDKRMVTCFNSADGVTILPTHRLLRDLPAFDPEGFLRRIADSFTVEPVASLPALWERMRRKRNEKVFGFYPASLRQFYLLGLKKGVPVEQQLDVSILHSLLLERFLGIDEAKLAAQSNIDYARDRDECIQAVNEGKYQAVFFLNPTTAEQLQRSAALGQRMPQKSTDFFPKLLTGLVFMRMQIEKP